MVVCIADQLSLVVEFDIAAVFGAILEVVDFLDPVWSDSKLGVLRNMHVGLDDVVGFKLDVCTSVTLDDSVEPFGKWEAVACGEQCLSPVIG